MKGGPRGHRSQKASGCTI